MTTINKTHLQQIASKIDPDAEVTNFRNLTGGVSARITAFDIINEKNGKKTTMVVREHGETDRETNPDVAQDEFHLLELLSQENVPVPTPYFVDDSQTILPIPYIVVAFVEGKTVEDPYTIPTFFQQLARQLHAIHSVDISQHDVSFLPDKRNDLTTLLDKTPREYDDAMHEREIRECLSKIPPLKGNNHETIVHGDFWPGNTMWRDNQLVSIIDWEDAGCGNPLMDVANCRLEVLWAYGENAMEEFTTQYQTLSELDFKHLPVWDLYAALRPAHKIHTWGLERSVLDEMLQKHKSFTEAAIKTVEATT